MCTVSSNVLEGLDRIRLWKVNLLSLLELGHWPLLSDTGALHVSRPSAAKTLHYRLVLVSMIKRLSFHKRSSMDPLAHIA